MEILLSAVTNPAFPPTAVNVNITILKIKVGRRPYLVGQGGQFAESSLCIKIILYPHNPICRGDPSVSARCSQYFIPYYLCKHEAKTVVEWNIMYS